MKKILLLSLFSMSTHIIIAQSKTIGKIDRYDAALDKILDANSKIEVLGEGFIWSEGPAWVKNGEYLLFSDVPANIIYRWKKGEEITEFLKPSGYTGIPPYSDEPGSNGLIINRVGNLVSCEHGDRRLAEMPLTVGGKRTLTDNYMGKRFNSPNDVVQKSNGDYYFTDPPYGLKGADNSQQKQQSINGVYRLQSDGQLTLLAANLTRPNGLAFSPDEQWLYVANSDPEAAQWWRYPVKADGTLGEGELFFDATAAAKLASGLPDGLKVLPSGILLATGPGGVWVLSAAGQHLGTIQTGVAAANVALNQDNSWLYITASRYLLRIKLQGNNSGKG